MTDIEVPLPRASHPVRAIVRSLVGPVFAALAALALVVAALVALPYVLQPIYTFPEARPFTGPALYNPYAGASGQWQRVNFHAHARAWLSITDGHQSDAAVVSHYRALGYQVAVVSNYQHIGRSDGDPLFLPVYEHGYNVDKVHQLVIGATRVDWLDFPWHQTLQNRQFVLDRLHRSGALVAIAHPELRDRSGGSEFRWLTNYDLMEVRTHSGLALAQWDTALSTGHAVWALADDDTHDVTNGDETGRTWTMVDAPSARAADVIASLRAGRMYGVDGPPDGNDVRLLGVEVRGDTLEVRLSDAARRVEFFGAQGAALAAEEGVRTARYVVPPTEPYVRTVVTTARTTMYLNPVIRWDGAALNRLAARSVPGDRGALAGLALLVTLAPTWTLWRLRRKRPPLA